MDLRHYIGKRIDLHKLIGFDHRLYEKPGGSVYPGPLVILYIQKNSGSLAAPDYSVTIHLNNDYKVISLHRSCEIWGAGSVVKKFSPEVEILAEKAIDGIFTP